MIGSGGHVSAAWRGRLVDIVSGLAMLAANIPSFWLGLIVIQMFAVRPPLPVAGYAPDAACSNGCAI